MRILDKNYYGPACSQPLDLPDEGGEGAGLLRERRQLHGRIPASRVDRQQGRQELDSFGCARIGLAEQGRELLELRVRAVTRIQPSRSLELRDDRVERAVDVIRGTEIAQPRMWLGGQPLVQRRKQPGLADTCFA
jgi:hypothetical protein